MTSSASSDSVRRPDPVVMERLIDCDIISMASEGTMTLCSDVVFVYCHNMFAFVCLIYLRLSDSI